MNSMGNPAIPELQASADARRLRIVLPGLLLALTLAALDQNIVSPALPRIVSDLGGLRLLSWVVTAFMVASTASAPLYGKLGDMYGRRPAFFVSIGIFLTGSALCGQAHSLFQLIGFRAIQGLGAGGLITLAQTTIADVVGPRERGRYQGIFAGVFAFCSVAGPLLGGVITDTLSWRWIFYVNLPIGAAALGFIAAGVPAAVNRTRHRIDYTGAALLVSGTVATLLVLSCGGTVFPWVSVKTAGLAAAALALFGGLFVVEHRAAEPILPPALFHVPVFMRSIGVIGLTMMAIFGTATFLPLYFQLELDASPSRAGLLMTPMMAGVIIASIVGGRAVSRTGRYRIFPIAGLLLASAGLASLGMFARMEPDAWLMGFMLGLTGLGLGLVMPNLTTAIQNAVPRENMGVATSSMAFFRSAGGASGVAIAGAILNAVLSGGLPIAPHDSLDTIRALDGPMRDAVMLAYRRGISDIFFAGAAVAIAACGIAWFIPEIPLRDKE
jgi:EmrB/QacA subfamily drug resistance transporter